MSFSNADSVAAVRRFNRFYTRRIGTLEEGQLGTDFTLAEMRVLYEIAHGDVPTAARIGRDLGLDAGYLSRILKGLARRRLVAREADPADARAHILRLTEAGHAAFAPLQARTQAMVAALLAPLAGPDRARVVGAMRTLEALLAEPAEQPVRLRTHGPGDLGWVVSRHGALYAQDYGWDLSFEALVARIAADFIEGCDPACERAFIAERAGERLGSAFVVRADAETAKLRLLLVEPHARGLGLGRRLVSACTQFARETGYRRIRLWTNDCLVAARAIYQREGYALVESAPHRSFGQDLVGETWELAL